MTITYLAAAAVLALGGLYLSAVAWGARLPPFPAGGDRLYLIVPGQLLTIGAVLCGFFAFGISLHQVQGWMSAVLTHGGP